MPLGRSDADRGLDLLWEFHREAEGDEERAAYAEAIASLHSYLTDLLPASQPLLRARAKEGFVDVRPLHETPVQSVVLTCNEGEKLGLSIDCVSLSKWGNSSDVSPYVVSLVKPGSAADREGSLRRGDQLVEVDGRPLAHVSLERARWLLDSAERRGAVKLLTVPLGLIDGMKHSVSREDLLSSLSVSTKKSPSHTEAASPPRKWGWKQGKGPEQIALHELQPVTDTRAAEQNFKRDVASLSNGGEERVSGSRASLSSSVMMWKEERLSRASSSRSSKLFQRRKVRKMHIMKGAHGLGLRIIGGKGSKHGNIGIFIREIDEHGAAHSDGRLKPGDEILMVDSKSLVGLTHPEAVGVLKNTQQLVQLVVATEVSEDQSITSSMASISEWARNPASLGPPPVFSSSSPQSVSPLSTGFTESGLEFVSPEFNPRPQKLGAFESFEMRGLGQVAKRRLPSEMETVFFSPSSELPAQRLSHGADPAEVEEIVREMSTDTEEIDVVLEKREGKSLGFTVCRGNGDIDGIFVKAIDPTGVAGRDGSLRVEDRLMEANGRSLTGLTHKQSASVIRGLKAGKVVLRVCRKLTRPSSKASSLTGSSSTEMETSLTDAEASQRTRGEATENYEDLGPPPSSPPPMPPPVGSSESDTEKEEAPSPPPTPPPSVPPSVSIEPPLPPLSLLPNNKVSERPEEALSQPSDGTEVEETQGDLSGEGVGAGIGSGEAELPTKEHASSQPKGVTRHTEWVSSDSDSDAQKEPVVLRKRGKKFVKQLVSSAARDDSSDIEIRGPLTNFTAQKQSVGKTASREESASDDATASPALPKLTDETVKEQGEEEGEPPLGFQKLTLQMKKRAKSGLGVTIVHSIGKTKGIYMVRRIMAGGVAARDKRVKPGDRLVSINGKSLQNLSHSEVLQTISEAPKEIQLEIWRDPNFEMDATSSIYSIGSRSSILSDEDTEDLLPKRSSFDRLISRDKGARNSPQIARYSASIADQIMSLGQPSPGTPKRWSAVILSPNIGPAGEILSSPPPTTSPTHTFSTPLNPIPSPNTLSPSPALLSLSPSPEPSTEPPFQPPPSPPPSPPPYTLPIAQVSTHSDSDGTQTPPPPPPPASPPPPVSNRPIPTEEHTPLYTAQQEESVFERRDVERPKSLGPVPKGTRLEHGPFEIEITKGIFGLGLSVVMGSVGMIVVQSLTSRSPIKKDGNIRVGDHLLSINDHSLIGVDVDTVESIIKALPRGVARFVAMAPPKDVTGSGLKNGNQSRGSMPSQQSTLPSALPPPPPASPLPEVIDEPGIVRVQLQRFGSASLGLIIEGGSESSLKYIFIKSIAFGSPAFSSGNFMKGDQLVMVGSECLIGMSLLQAKQVLEQAPGIVEVVAQRKESVKQSPPLAPKSARKGESSGHVPLKPGKTEERRVEAENNIGQSDKEKEKEMQFTESLPLPQNSSLSLQKDDREKQFTELFLPLAQSSSQPPLFRRSTSQTDMWMMETGSGASTSLGYASTTNLSASLNISRPAGALWSKRTSVENLHESTDARDYVPYNQSGSLQGPNYYVEQPPAKPAEEVFTVELSRESSHKLGLSIVGGADNPQLQEVHVKKVIADGLVSKDGRVKRGDRLISVNGKFLAGLTNKEALQILKESGAFVKLEISRRIGQRSQAPSPFQSQLQSRQSSEENTNEPPSPVIPPTPPNVHAPRNTLRRTSRRLSLSQDDDERPKQATMPRKLKSTEGIKIVELHKGPTGLGMNLKGGMDENLPIIVREVFPGGVAHKSGKIFPGDVIIEVNNDSFESLTHKEALHKLKSYPQGKISLLVKDRTATLPRKSIPQHIDVPM